MDLLINLDKPADQHGNRLYYVMDEQWTKLTAKDMRTALVNEKSEQRSSSKGPQCPLSGPLHLQHQLGPL